MRRGRVLAGLTLTALTLGTAACGGQHRPGSAASASSTTPPTTSAGTHAATPAPSLPASQSATRSGRPALGTVAPAWLGTRVLPRTADGYGVIRATPPELRDRRFTLPDTLAPLPGSGFASRVQPAPRSVLARSTWAPGCPVRASDLSWVRLTFWGFDARRHTGELLVDDTVAAPLVRVFRRLYDQRFPIEEMRISRKDEQTAPPTGDGNNTSAFNCRATRGATSYSQHAYGLAVDVNPFLNPYTKGDVVLPELASAYLDRGRVRPGMIEPGDAVVRAFAAIGWEWGGSFRTLKDLQHFSRDGT